MKKVYLAADFGGGSGRVIAGWLNNGRLEMEEIHRFPNRQIRMGNHIHWDFPALFQDMKDGMKKAAAKGYHIESIGIDTWGVDFGLIDRDGELMGNPVCYRDTRTQGMVERLFSVIPPTQHYATTGIQVMEINTLAQLLSMKGSVQLQSASHLLFMPDLFSYFLTGNISNEYSIASTSELLDATQRNWSIETIRALELPEHIFGPIVMPGTIRGVLKEDIAHEVGLEQIKVVAVGSHDTASAVAAVPAPNSDGPIAYLSSGTWSLLGVELPEPILTEQARQAQFTNEGGVGGRIRFLQNITGLWILQRLMAEWKERGEEQTFDSLLPQAAAARIDSTFAVDDPAFMNPVSMERAISDYCQNTGQQLPQTKAEYVHCLFRSLAKKYQQAVLGVSSMLPQQPQRLHIIGGGSQNDLLNQFTADAMGIPVWAGPVEATAMGNILVQAMTAGEIEDLTGIREIVRRSVSPKIFTPSKQETV